MAWLITLALFWWIGSSIAKGADKATDRRFEQGETNLQKLEPFLANFYVACWHFYQQMEPQALEQWTKKYQKKNLQPWDDPEYYRQEDDPHYFANRARWCKLQEQCFGAIADTKAAQVAFAQMMEHNCDNMMVPHPNRQQRNQYGMEFVPYQEGMKSDPDEAGNYFSTWCSDKIPVVYDYFDFKFASKATDPWVISLMPEIDDPGVAYYTVGRYTYTRHGTPEDYKAQVRQIRRCSGEPLRSINGKQKKQEFQITV